MSANTVFEPVDSRLLPFKPPNEWNATIWRYMDVAKYIAMLKERTLH
jgi:hypothetical protein